MRTRFIQPEDARSPRCGQARPRCHNRLESIVKLRHGQRILTRLAALCLLVLALGACSRTSEEASVSLPVTPVISARPQWAVAADVYVRIREEPSIDSPIEGHLRTGDVVEIVSITTRSIEGERGRDTWYEVAGAEISGWILGSSLDFYESRARALNASEQRDIYPTPPEAP
jgi:SH3 domain-containing protein